MTNTTKPVQYKFWCESARDRYNEREAIMREANHVPQDAETPIEIIAAATFEAQMEHNATEEFFRNKARQ